MQHHALLTGLAKLQVCTDMGRKPTCTCQCHIKTLSELSTSTTTSKTCLLLEMQSDSVGSGPHPLQPQAKARMFKLHQGSIRWQGKVVLSGLLQKVIMVRRSQKVRKFSPRMCIAARTSAMVSAIEGTIFVLAEHYRPL
eukprot:4513264-Amphidinium_carterae.1